MKNTGGKLNKYTGILEEYFETGMECLGLQFYDPRGDHEDVDCSDSTKTRMYRSLEWTMNFRKEFKYNIKVYKLDSDEIEYEGPLTIDLKKIAENKWHFDFLPKEVSKENFLCWCLEERKVELETDDCLMREKQWYIDYQEKIKKLIHKN